MSGAFFFEDHDMLVPLPGAISGWSSGMMRGPALTAAMARAAERSRPSAEMRPAHASFDLFRPARMVATATHARVVRLGRRLCLIDVALEQDGIDIAHGHITFLRPSEDPRGALWRPSSPMPPPNIEGDAESRLYRSDAGWTADPADHVSDARKSVWQHTQPLVIGEHPSPFQLAASASDLTSLVAHWGTEGIEFINADVTLSLARMPAGAGIGLRVTQFTSSDGLSAASAVLFDENGAFGTSTLSGLANAESRVRVDRWHSGSPVE